MEKIANIKYDLHGFQHQRRKEDTCTARMPDESHFCIMGQPPKPTPQANLGHGYRVMVDMFFGASLRTGCLPSELGKEGRSLWVCSMGICCCSPKDVQPDQPRSGKQQVVVIPRCLVDTPR